MKHLIVLLAACLCAAGAFAQKATTRQYCTRTCIEMDPDNPKKVLHLQRLKQIRDRMQAETDPDKRKAVAQEESAERERHQDALENMCGLICAGNPEE
ncbi:hypothetical protein [uncultured Massilia sp.]|uniref:hypothetical protein n=1 Tax=uncultured Massilia sp. TaxID=169973 RepID=UPI0025E3D1C0|nr:hypothetical protein [uncultured Massilia sp.]